MPKLEAENVSYYNPQTDNWHEDLIVLEAQAKDTCHCLLFVIDSQTRAMASMLEACEYILSGRPMLLVINNVPHGQIINEEKVSDRELKDLNRARLFLKDIVERHPNAHLFDTVEQAVEYVVQDAHQCIRCGRTEHVSRRQF